MILQMDEIKGDNVIPFDIFTCDETLTSLWGLTFSLLTTLMA